MKINLKGQISWFVIISVIIVIGAIVIVSLNSDNINVFSNDKSSYKVKQYVESCLEVETNNAIKKIGLHGGWLYHKPLVFTNRDNPATINKKAEGLNILEVNEIPYWYYYNDKDEIFETNIPEMTGTNEYSIENQIKKYLGDNLERNCIRNFEDFKDIYEIDYNSAKIKDGLNVIIEEEEVNIELELDIIINEITTQSIDQVNYFDIKTENPLWIPYHIAKDIVTAEINNSFLEHRMLGILSSYETTKRRDLLPPKYEFKVNEYDFEPWLVSDIIKTIKNILNSNIGEIQFINTKIDERIRYPELSENEFAQGYLGIYKKDYLSTTSTTENNIFREYRNYEVETIFEPFFPTSINIAPSLGNVILLPKPEAIANILPIFYTEYNAVYEITAPILFEIKNSNNYGNNFIFNLVIETNIDYNKPLRENKNIILDINLEEENGGQSLICDYPQFISEYVYLNISDPVNFGNRNLDDPQIGVEDAIVTFDCKGLANCFVTQTEINSKYEGKNITQLKFRLPINCNPGTLEIYKHNHKKLTFENLNPQTNKEINLGEVYLPSKKTMELDIQLLPPGKSESAVGEDIGEYDKVFIIITSLEDENLVEVIEVTKENQYDLNVDLTIGNYNLEAFAIYQKEIIIPSKKICVEKNMIGGGCKKHKTLPEINLTSWVRGGANIDFEIKLNQLLQRNTLKINLVDFGLPSSYDDLENSGDLADNIDIYKPIFIND